jgi:hypothetical protein
MIRTDENNELLCPNCKGNYLHHDTVAVYSRSEDAENVTQTTISNGVLVSSLVPSSRSANPSSRRDGLTISFWCEFCDSKPILTVAQHKGNTQVKWTNVE